MSERLFTIGKIIAPHGVRGEVRVQPLTDFPERFRSLRTALLDDGSQLPVAEVSYHKQFVLLKFKGLDSRNAIEPLRGKLLRVRQEELVKLPAGSYYHHEIIGLKVYEETGGYLGDVADILTTGSNDVYIVEHAGHKPLLIPALKQVVLAIDIPGGAMTVKLQEWDED